LQEKGNYISADEVRLYFEYINKPLLSENTPLLVFLHEGLGSVAQWKDFPLLLCEKLKLPGLLYDREGYGKSSELKSGRQIDYLHLQAQKVLPEIFNQLKLKHHKKILIGHSDGGSIAIIHAGSFHENISAVITMASHQFVEDITVKGLKEAIESYNKGRLQELLKKYHGDKTDSLFHAWSDTWTRKEFLTWNIENYLSDISCPCLGIQGVDDPYGSVAQLESIKKHVKNSEIYHVPHCGHIPHLQAKEDVLKKINEFISQLKTSSP
jgi:pimeloyl-ACP methyl ester carboxylesterase